MKGFLVLGAAAAFVAAAAPAQAGLIYGNPVQIVGATGRNPVVSTEVSIDKETNRWEVIHHLADGTRIDRGAQYFIVNNSDAERTRWWGRLHQSPALLMTGEISKNGPHHYVYAETLFDQNNGNAIVMRSTTDCEPEKSLAPAPVQAAAPASAPKPKRADAGQCSSMDGKTSHPCSDGAPSETVTAPAPKPTYAAAPAAMDRVPITLSKGGAYVAVSIGTMAVTMLVDTGATGMTVSEAVANWLVANGQATNGSTDHATLAGGVQKDFRGIDIGSVSVGGHVVRNVHAGVVPDGADMLLGLGLLAQVSPKFAINVATSTLDFE